MSGPNEVFAHYIATRTDSPSNLALLRRLHGVSAERLADLAGLSRETVYRLERGEHLPRPNSAERLAVVLDCDVALLFPGGVSGSGSIRAPRSLVGSAA